MYYSFGNCVSLRITALSKETCSEYEHLPVNFEEFRMYFDTAERNTDRRLELNKSNANTSLLILAGIGAILSWSFGIEEVQPYAVLVIGMISALAALYCRWWWRQLVSYKVLNGAKFEVLKEMAPLVVFSDETSCRSYEPFAREWVIMEKKKALQEYRKRLALGASLSELTVPISFLISFCSIVAVSLLISVIGRYDLIVLKGLGIE